MQKLKFIEGKTVMSNRKGIDNFDKLNFSAELLDKNNKISGTIFGAAENTVNINYSSEPKGDPSSTFNTKTYQLKNGTINISGFSNTPSNKVIKLAIVGGTGIYTGALGVEYTTIVNGIYFHKLLFEV